MHQLLWNIQLVNAIPLRNRSSSNMLNFLTKEGVTNLITLTSVKTRGNYAYFGDTQILYLFDKYSSASGGFVPID